MGDTISNANTSIIDKIQLFEHLQDPLFGKIDVYRFKEPPYQYIMDHKKNYIDDKTRLNKDYSQMNQIKNIEHQNLAKIYHTQIKQDTNLCIKSQKLHTYTNYYNFTLAQAIKKKKQTKYFFTEGDLIYIAQALVGLVSQLKKYGISRGVYRCEQIFLSPQGYVKLFLLQFDEENRHSCYYTVLSEKERLSEFLLAPEQLKSLKKLEVQTKFDQYSADLYSIGLILVELITLDQAKFYYNYDLFEIMAGKIQFVLQSYQSRYSKELLLLIQQILEVEPNNRITLDNAYSALAILSKKTSKEVHCIRLEADQNTNADKSFELHKGRKITLNSLKNRVTPKPISILSQHPSSNKLLLSTRTNSYRNSAKKHNNDD